MKSSLSSQYLIDHYYKFGDSLDRLFKKKGQSLKNLESFTGISRQRLARIAADEIIPSISDLWRIANAVGEPFGSLISPPEHRETLVLWEAKKQVICSSDGKFISRPLFPVDSQRLVEFYEITIAPDYIHHSEAHAPGTIESLIVVQGGAEITAGKEPSYSLSAGDAVVFEADVPHSYRNPGQADAVLHLVMSYIDLVDTK